MAGRKKRHVNELALPGRVVVSSHCRRCGAKAEVTHHEPPKGMGGSVHVWTAPTRDGLKPPKGERWLIALCNACHILRHEKPWEYWGDEVIG